MTDSEHRVLTVDGREIEISHPDKLMFPDDDITKLELAEYYARVAEFALPHYRGRALSMHRFPDGIAEDGFFQKSIADYFPDWIDRATLPKKDGEITHVIAETAATLVYLANQGCITLHLALSRVDRPDHPDRMIFDLDPSDGDFDKVRRTAGHVRRWLDRLEMTSFVQTTGSRGLHVVVPLDRSADFDAVRRFTRALCRRIAADDPDLMTVEQRKDQRGDRVFLDDLRNAYGQTAVAPYSVRALSGAPVATPLRWDEVDRGDLEPRGYRIDNLFRRLARIDDPWADLQRRACRLRNVSDIPGRD